MGDPSRQADMHVLAARGAPVELELEDGTRLQGQGFGLHGSAAGEVVFNTSMVGYVESLTDPSYRGQILVMTYPLIGSYGVPAARELARFESDRVQAAGLIVSTLHHDTSHAGAARSLHDWLAEEQVPGIEGVDTRLLTLKLRERGTMLGRVLPVTDEPVEILPYFDPDHADLVADVSTPAPVLHGQGAKRVVLVDCGAKRSILTALLARGVQVLQVPHDHDYTGEPYDGVLVSNGPGNPERCGATISVLRRAMARARPIFGICLGSQLLALAAGAHTYKLRYGHRGQNQPCREVGTHRAVLTSQNHGFAVNADTLPDDWEVWYVNANDGSVEGIRHKRRPFQAVQFHPEARPGPLDSQELFDRFVASL
jgi:carbamoyl-phosphate synthase small subunit